MNNPTLLITDLGGRSVCVIALAAQGEAVPAHAVVGHAPADGDRPDWRTFATSAAFLQRYSRYMRGELAVRPRVLGEGRVRAGDKLYVIDPRTPTPQGDVPSRDIVGYYETDAGGVPRAETFSYNPKHLFVTPEGKLSGVLHDAALWQALSLNGPGAEP